MAQSTGNYHQNSSLTGLCSNVYLQIDTVWTLQVIQSVTFLEACIPGARGLLPVQIEVHGEAHHRHYVERHLTEQRE